jgi:predicted pyridoxine 5'-phosphate oxidase superfamily flavin-nucleotide-binding protein
MTRQREFPSDIAFTPTVKAIQQRGGPPGLLRVLDERTLAFADYRGNRQYISQGNLVDNPKAFLFLIDYAHRQRIKIWGEARVVEDDPQLVRSLMPEGYKARPEQAFLLTVAAQGDDMDTAGSIALWQRLERIEQSLCLRVNRGCRYPWVKGLFSVVSRLGDGGIWYLLMLVLVVNGEGTAPLDRYSFPSGHTLHAVCFTLLAVAHVPGLASRAGAVHAAGGRFAGRARIALPVRRDRRRRDRGRGGRGQSRGLAGVARDAAARRAAPCGRHAIVARHPELVAGAQALLSQRSRVPAGGLGGPRARASGDLARPDRRRASAIGKQRTRGDDRRASQHRHRGRGGPHQPRAASPVGIRRDAPLMWPARRAAGALRDARPSPHPASP